MPWKLKPRVRIGEYTSTMKFYKVKVPVKKWNEVPVELRQYRKWAWDNCGGSWAITQAYNRYGAETAFFYIGFELGEDKMVFRLAHDPNPVAMVEDNLHVFARIYYDK